MNKIKMCMCVEMIEFIWLLLKWSTHIHLFWKYGLYFLFFPPFLSSSSFFFTIIDLPFFWVFFKSILFFLYFLLHNPCLLLEMKIDMIHKIHCKTWSINMEGSDRHDVGSFQCRSLTYLGGVYMILIKEHDKFLTKIIWIWQNSKQLQVDYVKSS